MRMFGLRVEWYLTQSDRNNALNAELSSRLEGANHVITRPHFWPALVWYTWLDFGATADQNQPRNYQTKAARK